MIPLSSESGMLRILLLGPPAIYLGGQPYQIDRRLNRSLLFYLAAQEAPVSRAELIELFWPEADEETGRKRLRETLSKLRSDLPDASLLLSYQDQVSLDFDRIYVDRREFQALVNQTSRALQMYAGMPLPEPTYQQLVKAARLWRSPRFMAGANLSARAGIDSWLVASAQTQEFILQRVLVRLAEHSALTGDLETALQWMYQATEVEPFNDDNHLRVLQWLRDLGRRGDALKYFQQVSADYERDGYRLPAEILQLGADLQQEAAHPAVEDALVWRSATLQVPLIGRDDLLAQLRLSFQRGSVVLLSGEAGSGKSRLVQELFQSLEPAPRLLVAFGRASETDLPFQPLVDMLRTNVSQPEWERLGDPWAAWLSLLLPELSSWRPDVELPENTSPVENRQNIYEAVRQLLLQMARQQRVLCFLDDAQWCDEETLGALTYLLEREFFKDHGLLVIAVRTEDCHQRLESFFRHPRLSTLAENVRLPLFTREQVAAVAQFALGETPPAELVDRLHQYTGGNPLFLLETLRVLLDTADLHNWSQWSGRLPLPGSIHSAVRERLRHIDRQAQRVLMTAAVIGHTFRLDVLQAAAELDHEQFVSVVECLERSFLIQPDESESASNVYSFVHGQMREVLLLEQSEARRQLLNRRVARAIELHGGELSHQADVLARHYEAAGEPAAAFSYWLAHAEWCGEQAQCEQAYAAYRQAESLFFRLDRALPDSLIYRMYRGWGELAFDNEDMETLNRSYSALQRLGEERRAPQLVAAGWNGMFLANTLTGQPGQAQRCYERAVPLLEQLHNVREKIDILNYRGLFCIRNNRFQEAEEVLLQALELGKNAVEPGDWEARIFTHTYLAIACNYRGWPQRAYHLARLAVAESYRVRRASLTIQANNALAFACYLLGRYEESIETAAAACSLAENRNDRRNQANLRLTIARSQYVLGRLDEAWAYSQSTLQIARLHNFADLVCAAYVNLGDILRSLGDLEGAQEQYMLAVSDAVGGLQSIEAQYRLGITLSSLGKTQEGIAYVTQALEYGQMADTGLISLPAEMVLAYVNVRTGDAAAVGESVEQLLSESRQRGLAVLVLVGDLLAARLAARRNDLEALQKRAQRLVDRSRKLGNIWLELAGLKLLIRTATRDRECEAERLRARSLFDRLLAHARTPELRVRVEQFRRAL